MGVSESIFTIDPTAEEGLPFTARDVLRVLFKHKVLILTCLVVLTAVVAGGLSFVPLSYEAGAKVMIKTELQVTPSFFSGIAAYREPPLVDPAGRRIETEMELLETTPLAEEVVKTLGLEYDQVYHKPYVHVLDRVGDALDAVLGLFGYPRDPDKYGFRPTVEALRSSLVVKPIKSKSAEANSNIIDISLKAASADIAHKALDVLLVAYTKYDIALNQQAGEKAHNIVRLQLEETAAKVREAQERMRRFLLQRAPGGRAPVIAAAGEGDTASTDRLVTTPRDQTSLSLLKSRLIELELERLDAQKTFQGDSERARMLGRSIESLQQRVTKEIKNDAENNVTLIALERDLRTIETEYIEIDKKLAQIALFLKMNEQQPSNRVVVEPPVTPRSSDKKRRVFLVLLSSMGGLLVGLGLAGLREYGDRRFRSAAEVQKFLRLEVLSSIPRLAPASFAAALRPTPDGSDLSAAEVSLVFHRLALRIVARAGRSGPCTLLVTSIQDGEGKSSVSRAIAAYAAAQSELRVLLVETDFRHPRAGDTATDTFADALHTGAFPRRMDHPASANLSVLPAGGGEPVLLFKTKGLTTFIAAAREAFDLVVFDGSSLSTLGASSLPYLVDSILLVVDSQTCRREVAQSVLAPLEIPPSKWMGAVLNNKVRYIPDALYRRF